MLRQFFIGISVLLFCSCDLYESKIDRNDHPLWYYSKATNECDEPLDSMLFIYSDAKATLNLYKDSEQFDFFDSENVRVCVFNSNGKKIALIADPAPYFYELGPEGFEFLSGPGSNYYFKYPVDIKNGDFNSDGFDDILIFHPKSPGSESGTVYFLLYNPFIRSYELCKGGIVEGFRLDFFPNSIYSEIFGLRTGYSEKTEYFFSNHELLPEKSVALSISEFGSLVAETRFSDTIFKKILEHNAAERYFDSVSIHNNYDE